MQEEHEMRESAWKYMLLLPVLDSLSSREEVNEEAIDEATNGYFIGSLLSSQVSLEDATSEQNEEQSRKVRDRVHEGLITSCLSSRRTHNCNKKMNNLKEKQS